MSLGLALNNAVSGLRLNQEALSVLSNNLANVNTEGYTRKVLNQTAVYVEGVGSGVNIESVGRKVDAYLQRSLQTQGSETQKLSTISDYYGRVQVLLGEPGATNSLDEYMTTFFNSVSQLAEQPERTSYRSNLVNSASQLAQNVSGTASELESLRYEADQDISGSIKTVNASIKKLFDLNVAIGRAVGTGTGTAGFLDERDMALKSLSEQMNVDIFYNPNGSVTVTGGNGVPLVDGAMHALKYAATTSVDAMVNNQRLGAITVVNLSADGQEIGAPATLVTGGQLGQVQSQLTGGKLQGLIELRDKLLPNVLDQLDMVASRLRDSMNAINNNGSGYPPAHLLTATRSQIADQEYNWTGSVRIAVLNADGTPVTSPYNSENYTGLRPLTLDLSKLQSNGTDGRFNVVNVINEINNAFGPPGVKTSLGNIGNIQLASESNQIPTGASTRFKFDLDVDNISGSATNLFVHGITVKDSTGADITNVVQNAPALSLSPVGTYTTYNGESKVDIQLQSANGLHAGDRIYLGPPATANVNNISAANLTGYFVIESINGNAVTINTAGTANASGSVADATTTAQAAYQNVAAGNKDRSATPLEVDLSNNISSLYYDITVDMDTVGTDGVVRTSQVTYRVQNQQQGMNGRRFDSIAADGQATRELPTTTQGVARAMLVDEHGQEIPTVNGGYAPGVKGFLKIVANAANAGIAIDELDSRQLGDEAQLSRVPASNLGFSSYFGLNNFFAANKPVEGGETLRNSAINLHVEQRVIDNPNLISSGTLVQTQAASANDIPQYTYGRYAGDNQVAQRMAALASGVISFDAAGGLPPAKLSLQSYASELLGYVASLSAGATDAATNAQTLYDGFDSRLKAATGVNLDEELSNTVIFQNAYSATARIVSVVDEMFKSLIDAT